MEGINKPIPTDEDIANSAVVNFWKSAKGSTTQALACADGAKAVRNMWEADRVLMNERIARCLHRATNVSIVENGNEYVNVRWVRQAFADLISETNPS